MEAPCFASLAYWNPGLRDGDSDCTGSRANTIETPHHSMVEWKTASAVTTSTRIYMVYPFIF